MHRCVLLCLPMTSVNPDEKIVHYLVESPGYIKTWEVNPGEKKSHWFFFEIPEELKTVEVNPDDKKSHCLGESPEELKTVEVNRDDKKSHCLGESPEELKARGVNPYNKTIPTVLWINTDSLLASTPAWEYQDIVMLQNPFNDAQPLQTLVQCSGASEINKSTEVTIEPSNEVKSSADEIEVASCRCSEEVKGLHDVSFSGDHVQDSAHSLSRSLSEKNCCRICQEDDTDEKLISPCFCMGSVGFMHFSCLERWLQTNCRTSCELCSYPFPVEREMPSILTFFSHPTQNMDMPSFLCDISCFFMLTPLLIASTYLCSIGVTHYQGTGKSESVFAVTTLMISLITVYFAWATLAVLYHRRVWLTWREKNANIRMLTDTNRALLPVTNLKETCLESDSVASDSCKISSHQDSTSILLRPIVMLTKGKTLKVHSSVASLKIMEPSRT